MKRIFGSLLLVLALFVCVGVFGSLAVASEAMKSTGGNESSGTLCTPDLDPGCPYGWSRGRRGTSPAYHHKSLRDSSSNADLHGKGPELPDQVSTLH